MPTYGPVMHVGQMVRLKAGCEITDMPELNKAFGEVKRITPMGVFTQVRVAWPDTERRAMDPVYEDATFQMNMDIEDLEGL